MCSLNFTAGPFSQVKSINPVALVLAMPASGSTKDAGLAVTNAPTCCPQASMAITMVRFYFVGNNLFDILTF